MPAATVLMPTHDHGETLLQSVPSVLEQTLDDFELFIVGDGVSDETRAIARQLAASDPRVCFFDFPKGPRKGEVHRHEALKKASGRFVSYIGDDDLYLPNHLEVMDALLRDADFGHTVHIGIDKLGKLYVLPADLENQAVRRKMLTEDFNLFDFTFGGHTLEAYRRLPAGWDATPPDVRWSDHFMWRQFLAQPWCRAKSAIVPTCINTQTRVRPGMTNSQRAAELAEWRLRSAAPEFREELWRFVAESLNRNFNSLKFKTA